MTLRRTSFQLSSAVAPTEPVARHDVIDVTALHVEATETRCGWYVGVGAGSARRNYPPPIHLSQRGVRTEKHGRYRDVVLHGGIGEWHSGSVWGGVHHMESAGGLAVVVGSDYLWAF